jgi:hypothetical protein
MSFLMQILNFPVDKKTAGQVSGHREDFGTDQVGRLFNGFHPLTQCYNLNTF